MWGTVVAGCGRSGSRSDRPARQTVRMNVRARRGPGRPAGGKLVVDREVLLDAAERVLDQGPLHRALMASIAIPGALPPVLVLNYDPQAAMGDDLDQSVVREFLLSLDVAHVARTEQPFARLRQVAAALCESMDGVLCDQNGNPLPAMAMDPIAADLEQLYDQLDGRDLSAGSPQARRLFS